MLYWLFPTSFYQVFHSDSHHFTSSGFHNINFPSALSCLSLYDMLFIMLFFSQKQHKKRIEESTSIHTLYIVVLIHYVSNQRSIVLSFIARLPRNAFNKHLRRAGAGMNFPIHQAHTGRNDYSI